MPNIPRNDGSPSSTLNAEFFCRHLIRLSGFASSRSATIGTGGSEDVWEDIRTDLLRLAVLAEDAAGQEAGK